MISEQHFIVQNLHSFIECLSHTVSVAHSDQVGVWSEIVGVHVMMISAGYLYPAVHSILFGEPQSCMASSAEFLKYADKHF